MRASGSGRGALDQLADDDQRGRDVLEDYTIRDSAAVAAERVGGRDGGTLGQQGGELEPDGLQQACW